jgi:hypothetical protein
MKKTVMIIALFLLAIPIHMLMAQDTEARMGHRHDPGHRLLCLDLSEEQQEAIQGNRDEFRQAKDNLIEASDLKPGEYREQMRALRERFEEELEEILTEEQVEILHRHKPMRSMPGFKMQGFNKESHALILEKRREFDQVLSNQEKEIINELRAELRKLRNERRQANPERMRDSRAQRVWTEKMHKRMCALDPIIENHRDELDAIRETMPSEARPRPEMHRGVRHREGSGRRGEDRFSEDRHFLLLDPDRKSGGILEAYTGDSENIKLYPNPVEELLNINFETKSKGSVTIELLNKEGVVLELVDESYRDSGKHSILLDVSQLKSGEIHFIRITSTKDSIIGKFIKI